MTSVLQSFITASQWLRLRSRHNQANTEGRAAKIWIGLIGGIVLAAAANLAAQTPECEGDRIVASDGMQGDYFGTGAAISGSHRRGESR